MFRNECRRSRNAVNVIRYSSRTISGPHVAVDELAADTEKTSTDLCADSAVNRVVQVRDRTNEN
jgi:hypothetical protein